MADHQATNSENGRPGSWSVYVNDHGAHTFQGHFYGFTIGPASSYVPKPIASYEDAIATAVLLRQYGRDPCEIWFDLRLIEKLKPRGKIIAGPHREIWEHWESGARD